MRWKRIKRQKTLLLFLLSLPFESLSLILSHLRPPLCPGLLRRPTRARTATMVSLVCAVLLGLAAMAFTNSVRHHWGRLFTDDSEVLALTAATLTIAGLCKLGNCPQIAGCGVLRGSARPTTDANINLSSFYLIDMPVSILMGFSTHMGFAGLWLCLLATQASCAALMAYARATLDTFVHGLLRRVSLRPCPCIPTCNLGYLHPEPFSTGLDPSSHSAPAK